MVQHLRTMQVDFSNQTTLRVRYGETDQMGYSYYGNYAEYFEVGRVEALREIGMSYKSLEAHGVMLPVSEMHVHYKTPAKYDDALNIETRIVEIKGARISFNYTIRNEEDAIVATGSTILVFVSKETMRPIQPPKVFTDVIEKYYV